MPCGSFFYETKKRNKCKKQMPHVRKTYGICFIFYLII